MRKKRVQKKIFTQENIGLKFQLLPQQGRQSNYVHSRERCQFVCVEVVCPYPMDRSAVRQCGANAICAVANHVATCQCETGFYPNTTPEEGCVECTEVSHCTNGQTCHYKKCSMSCTQDSDCADTESCKTGQCENVNCDQLSCGSNAQCVIANHAATCQCNSGYHTATTADDGCCKFYYNSQTPIEQYFDSYL